MPNNLNRTRYGTPARDEGTEPRGPHRGHGDEAAGGAERSPLETVPSGSKRSEAQDPGGKGNGPDPQFPQPPAPR
jgi:hypothetical protein